ncbi:hypothetical protein [Streptomyces sp. NPDC054854]
MDRHAGRPRGCRNLNHVQVELAARLAARAERLRAEANLDGGERLSVAEAVALAVVQLGLRPPVPTSRTMFASRAGTRP